MGSSAPMLPLFIAVIVGTVGQAVCMVVTREKKAPVSTVPEPVAPVPEPVEGTPAATSPDASTHFDKLNDRSASEPTEEISEETVEEILEEPVEESAEETVEEPLGESVEETVEETIEEPVEEVTSEDKPESVEIEEPEADIPLAEAVKTMSAHELAAKLFPKKEPPRE